MHQKLSWLWPVSVIVFCCLPLFVGLGQSDLQGDEAIYSFGVDQILQNGDWLVPRSSPEPRAPFLEKPPLKFWIVAAPIRAGLLPRNEFGLRFWDAVFGSVAFLYVFWMTRRLSSNIGGVVAALILIVHMPLVFQHGLRSNNMEGPLVLSYCGGIAHYLAWTAATSPRSRRVHAVAVAMYFVLGFMTKFVAVAFMPFVIVATGLLTDRGRSFWRDRRMWIAAGGLALLLIAPWFVFATVRFGSELWSTILRDSIFVRFTTFLDPGHVQPWYFYFVQMYQSFVRSGTVWLVGAGLALMLVQTFRRPSPERVAVLLWGVVPLCAISLGTSKLFHYAYPFVPPLAIAGGVFAGWVFDVVRDATNWLLGKIENGLSRPLAPLGPLIDRPVVRGVLFVATLLGLALVAATLAYGPVRVNLGGIAIRSSGIARPLVIAAVCAVLGGSYRKSGPVAALLAVALLLPFTVYADQLTQLQAGTHPMRSARDCLLRVQAEAPPGPPGIFIDAQPTSMGHPIYFYFMPVRPWVKREWAPPEGLAAYMYDPKELRPALTEEKSYDAFIRRHDLEGGPNAAQTRPTMIRMADTIVLLLPPQYSACAPSATPQ